MKPQYATQAMVLLAVDKMAAFTNQQVQLALDMARAEAAGREVARRLEAQARAEGRDLMPIGRRR